MGHLVLAVKARFDHYVSSAQPFISGQNLTSLCLDLGLRGTSMAKLTENSGNIFFVSL
jgi:hypothetical protein